MQPVDKRHTTDHKQTLASACRHVKRPGTRPTPWASRLRRPANGSRRPALAAAAHRASLINLRMRPRTPRTLLGAVLGAVTGGFVGGVAVGLAAGLTAGVAGDIEGGFVIGIIAGLKGGSQPGRIGRIGWRELRTPRTLAAALAAGLAIGRTRAGAATGLAAGSVAGLASGLASGLVGDIASTTESASPVQAWRDDLATKAVLGIVAGLATGPVAGLLSSQALDPGRGPDLSPPATALH